MVNHREFDAPATGTNPGLDRRYGGKEKDATLPSSPFFDFEARMYNPVYARFTTMDPMAEKYYSISPYAYCAGNPVNLVDPDGRIPRIYIQKEQTGHAFITIGEGANTTVYTYGRYGAISPISSGITLGNLNPKGEGVLGILKGKDAESYLQSVYEEGDFDIFYLPTGDEKAIESFYQDLFYQGAPPTNEKKATYNNPNFRVIDEYDLLGNNFVTKTQAGINASGVQFQSETIIPVHFGEELYDEVSPDSSIHVIANPLRFVYNLLSEFFYAK